MKKLVYALIAGGVFFGISLAGHAVLVSIATGDGDWSVRAAGTCAGCHGG